MIKLRATYDPQSLELYKNSNPERPIGTLIDEDALIETNEGDKILYLILKGPMLQLAEQVCRETKAIDNNRTMGARTRSSIFGLLPRNPIRHNYCRFSQHSHTERGNFHRMLELNKMVFNLYKEHFPTEATQSLVNTLEAVDRSWNIVKTPFLTMNVNFNHAIRYHRDAGNFDAYSNVLVVKKGMEGGELVFPELNLTLSQRHGAFAIFNGKKFIHGCTPLIGNGIRGSLVFYSMDQCRNCLGRQAEHERYKQVESARNRSKFSTETKDLLKRAVEQEAKRGRK